MRFVPPQPTWTTPPSSPTSAGTVGQHAFNSSYYYVCTAPSVWARGSIATWNVDQYFSSVSALLHMDGADGSTVFTDNSANALTVAPSVATISTTYSKFGGSSAYFNGSSAYLDIASNSAFALPGDFTIECWVYLNRFNSGSFEPVFANEALFYIGETGQLLFFYSGSNVATGTAGDVSVTTWTHIAACRSGSTLKLYANGAQKASVTFSTAIASGNPNRIGRYGSAYFPGYIDDFRVTKGVARYTGSTLTIPTTAFLNE